MNADDRIKELEEQLEASRAEVRALKFHMDDYEWCKGHGRYWQDVAMAFNDALANWPAMPSPQQLKTMGEMPCAKYPEDSEAGKKAQRALGLDAIPPVSEMEKAAGMWLRITGQLNTI